MAEKLKGATVKGELTYINITGKGKTGLKNSPNTYQACIILDKKDADELTEKITDYFNENKVSGYVGGDKKVKRNGKSKIVEVDENTPFNNISEKMKDGRYLFSFKTYTEFDGKQTSVRLYDAKNNEVELPEGESIGNGSLGRIAYTLSIYGDADECGVSMFLNSIKLLKYVPYKVDSGFGDEEDEGDFDGFGNTTSEFNEVEPEPKKDKKKKKKSKK